MLQGLYLMFCRKEDFMMILNKNMTYVCYFGFIFCLLLVLTFFFILFLKFFVIFGCFDFIFCLFEDGK